jgi:hypothetical protein
VQVDIFNTPEFESLSEYRKENVKLITKQWSNLPEATRDNNLLIFAAVNEINAIQESNYHLIFGTQISLLTTLQSNAALDDIQPFYEQHLVKLKESGITVPPGTFEQWRGFMIDNNLITIKDAKYMITSKGMDLLKYIEAKKYTLNKGL